MSFVLSKILWVLVAPANLFAFVLLFSVFAADSKKPLFQKWGRRIVFGLACGLFLMAVLPVGDWMMGPLENRYSIQKPDHVDGILILGGDENPLLTEARGYPALGQTAMRYIALGRVAQDYPNAPIVFVGGSGSLRRDKESVSFSDIARRAIDNLGIDAKRVKYEEISRNTFENATFSAKIINPKPEQKWLLVTSAFHMPRSVLCFQKAGWSVVPYPTDFKTTGVFDWHPKLNLLEQMTHFSTSLREYIGLVAYWMMGRIDRVWP